MNEPEDNNLMVLGDKEGGDAPPPDRPNSDNINLLTDPIKIVQVDDRKKTKNSMYKSDRRNTTNLGKSNDLARKSFGGTRPASQSVSGSRRDSVEER